MDTYDLMAEISSQKMESAVAGIIFRSIALVNSPDCICVVFIIHRAERERSFRLKTGSYRVQAGKREICAEKSRRLFFDDSDRKEEKKMYKTECSQCHKIYETEVKYYNFVCGECTRKNQEEKAELEAREKERSIATLQRLRKEMEDAIAGGDEKRIEFATFAYNHYAESFRRKYGDIDV